MRNRTAPAGPIGERPSRWLLLRQGGAVVATYIVSGSDMFGFIGSACLRDRADISCCMLRRGLIRKAAMASYGLYLGKLQGEVLLHKNHKATMPADSVGFDAAALSELGISHDPYRTRTWSGESLEELGQQVHDALSRREEEIRETIKVRMRQPGSDSWMLPVIQRQIESDRRYKTICELVRLVERAAIENGTIIYWSD